MKLSRLAATLTIFSLFFSSISSVRADDRLDKALAELETHIKGELAEVENSQGWVAKTQETLNEINERKAWGEKIGPYRYPISLAILGTTGFFAFKLIKNTEKFKALISSTSFSAAKKSVVAKQWAISGIATLTTALVSAFVWMEFIPSEDEIMTLTRHAGYAEEMLATYKAELESNQRELKTMQERQAQLKSRQN